MFWITSVQNKTLLFLVILFFKLQKTISYSTDHDVFTLIRLATNTNTPHKSNNNFQFLWDTMDMYFEISPSDPPAPTWQRALQHELEVLAHIPDFPEDILHSFHPVSHYTGRHQCRSVDSPIQNHKISTTDSFGDTQENQKPSRAPTFCQDDTMNHQFWKQRRTTSH